LESLEKLSDRESEILWSEEAEHRDIDWDKSVNSGRIFNSALRKARGKLK